MALSWLPCRLAHRNNWPFFCTALVPTIGVLEAARNVYFAGGYSGHGVGVAFLAGRLLRDLYAGTPLDPAYDFVLNRKPPRFPGDPLNSLGFALYKRYLRWADAR